MSLNEILGSATSGLAAAQAGLRSVSNNVANVGTPGYARERVSLSTGVTSGRTSGVRVGEPERIADRFLEAAVYARSGDLGRSEATASYLDRLQSLLGAPGAESGLPARLDAIGASAIRMTSGQATTQNVAAFTGDVDDAIGAIRQLGSDIDGLRGDVESEVGYSVDRVNGLLVRIHDLNDEVARMEGLGRSAAGAMDQRLVALEELSGLVKLTVRDQPDGRVTIETATGAVLLDKRLRQLDYPSPGIGVSQPVYPPIAIRFADAPGQLGAATGERLESAAIGGKLGGLIDLRDRSLPQVVEKLGVLVGGLAETLNAAANAGTTLPPPARLEGRSTGLVGGDRLGFAGSATFAIVKANGDLVASTSVDFAALGPAATVDDAVAAINAGLSGAGTASFAGGKLTIAAAASGNGVAVAQGTVPSARAGIGFSHYFGLNDLVHSSASTLVPSGFTAADPHGFGPGETAEIVLRDATGRALSSHALTATGTTFGDLVTQLNGSTLGSFGSFALDPRGRIQFSPNSATQGAALTIVGDSTDRFGTGRSFTALSGLTGQWTGLDSAGVRPDMAANPALVPLARLQPGAVGGKAIGASDLRGAAGFVDQLARAIDLGKDGVATLDRFSSLMLGRIGSEAARAEEGVRDATARRDDASSRRDSFAGVNIDEELAQMVVLQNSYSAAARVMSTASTMYDTLLAMID